MEFMYQCRYIFTLASLQFHLPGPSFAIVGFHFVYLTD